MVRWGMMAALTLGGVLSGCNKAPDQPAPDAATAPVVANVAAKPAAFAQCAACHSVEPGVIGIGPSLAGVVGRKAGTLPGFTYSDAMKAYGKTWDAAALDTFLTSPAKALPGTRMTYMGQSDPAQRQAVIAYLTTLK